MIGKELKAMISSIPDEAIVNIDVQTSGSDSEIFKINNTFGCEVKSKSLFSMGSDDFFYVKTHITFKAEGVETK